MSEYARILTSLIEKADTVNAEKVKTVSALIADCVKNDGVIYMFGCGHSGLIAQDCFYRAGGLANIQPVFVPELMLHISASESSKKEKREENAAGVLDGFDFTKNDLLFVISVSGINGVPVEVARQGKEKGLKVIGMGSSSYAEEKSRHSSGKRLEEFCDVFLDNCVPKGDAVFSLKDGGKAVPVSTAVSSFLMQACIYGAFLKCEKDNIKAEFFGSGNLAENVGKNAGIVDKFRKRIKYL